MKKILLSIICFLACIYFIQAQTLFGTTLNGGNNAGGSIIKFIPASNSLSTERSFEINDSTNGSEPCGSLMLARDGKLYGMTTSGGSSGDGIIFTLDPLTSIFKKLHDFNGIDGASPSGGLFQASNGKLYGMAYSGGRYNYGVIFSYDPFTGIYSKLHDFDYTNGAESFGGFAQADDGKFYGMTELGGVNGFGIIFSFDPTSTSFTKLMDFDSTNGRFPAGNFVKGVDGKLYGVTPNGGNIDAGVLFSFDPILHSYTKLMDFDGTNGGGPLGSLIQASDGKFYGMSSSGGGFNRGVIYSFDPATLNYKKLVDFDVSNGYNPYGSLMQASNGKLYGMTSEGGINGYGIIFSFDLSSSNFTKLQDYKGLNQTRPYFFDEHFIEVKQCVADTTYYRDADADGYGNHDSSIKACSQPVGYVKNNTDCDDTRASVHPGATEICGNGIDDNCNGQIDENCQVGYTVSINDVTVKESQGVAVLTVTLSSTSSKPVWLLYYTKDGTATSRGWHRDYETRIGWLYIRPGSRTASIYIKIIKDRIAEHTEYFDVILWRSLNATIADGSGRVYITDDTRHRYDMSADFNLKTEIASANSLEINVMPNPTASGFNLTIASNNRTGKIDLKVMDVQGKLIETRNNLMPGQTIRIGSQYRPGTYFIQVMQAEQKRTIEVIKLSE